MTPEELVIVADRSSSMKAVLVELGYDIWKIPLQIPCPVHKLGVEVKPSARIYEDDKAVWCFSCLVQYTATQVWSSLREVDRTEAAVSILNKWPVPESQALKVLREFRVPKKIQIVDVYSASIERHLTDHRGLANFTEYRKWAKASDDFVVFLKSISIEDQEIAVQSFVERLDRELLASYEKTKLNGSFQ